ncbi:Thioredoxin reductase 1, cytoplasmic, partial [Trichinella sp. T9]
LDSRMPPVDNVKKPQNLGSLLELIFNSKTITVVSGRRLKLNKINDYLLSIGSKPCQIADISSIQDSSVLLVFFITTFYSFTFGMSAETLSVKLRCSYLCITDRTVMDQQTNTKREEPQQQQQSQSQPHPPPPPPQQQQQQPQQQNKQATSGRESDSDDEDSNSPLEESPCGRWQKRRERVQRRNVPGIDATYLAMDNELGVEVAWNEVHFNDRRQLMLQQRSICAMFDRLVELDHPYLVKVHSYWLDEDRARVVLITDYMSSGSVAQFLRRTAQGGVSTKPPSSGGRSWRKWCLPVLLALDYLHSFEPPVVHGHLTNSAIFIQQNGVIKVAFVMPEGAAVELHGLRSAATSREGARQHHQHMYYVAPECRAPGSRGTVQADIYAFGVCALEMAAMGLLGDGDQLTRALQSLENPSQRQLVEQCFSTVPSQRPTAHQLIFHPALFEVPSLLLLAAHEVLRGPDTFSEFDPAAAAGARGGRHASSVGGVGSSGGKLPGRRQSGVLAELVGVDGTRHVMVCREDVNTHDLEKLLEDVRNGIYPLAGLQHRSSVDGSYVAGDDDRCPVSTGDSVDASAASAAVAAAAGGGGVGAGDSDGGGGGDAAVVGVGSSSTYDVVSGRGLGVVGDHRGSSLSPSRLRPFGGDPLTNGLQHGVSASLMEPKHEARKKPSRAGEFEETRELVELSAEVRPAEQSGAYVLAMMLKFEDRMNRELTGQFTDDESPEALSDELVEYGFVRPRDHHRLVDLIGQAMALCRQSQSTVDEINKDRVLRYLFDISCRNLLPLIFVNGDCVGGVEELARLVEKGILKEWLADHQYDLVVIGGGSGGLAAAKDAALAGKRVAVLDFVTPTPLGTTWGLGGTCVNVGCIPKKLMHCTSLLGKNLADARKFGWKYGEEVKHSWTDMVTAIQSHITSLNWNYRVQLREKSVTYLNAFGTFVGSHSIKATDKRNKEQIITSDRFIIATGLRPRYLDVPGVKEYCITSDDVFSLPYCPGKTLCVGASYVSLECAGFLRGLGLDVTVMVRSILLRGFDQDMANRVGNHMQTVEGVRFIYKCIPTKIERLQDGQPGLLRVTAKKEDGEEVVDEYNTVLIAIGRDALTDALNLDKVGVETHPKNKKILCYANEQSTTAPYIYAIGDVLYRGLELTPVAIKAGRLLAKRLFGLSNILCDRYLTPTTVFTPLEYGCCGMSEEEAIEEYGEINIEVFHSYFTPLEYTVPKRDDSEHCYAKLICNKHDDMRILGFHLLGPNAGEITQGFAIGLKLKATKHDFDLLVGIHPTCAEVFTQLTVTKSSQQVLKKTGC